MTSPGQPIRICTRVADMLLAPEPSSVEDKCARCGDTVYVTIAQSSPFPEVPADAIPVCTRCIVGEDDLREGTNPSMLWMMKRCHQLADMLNGN